MPLLNAPKKLRLSEGQKITSPTLSGGWAAARRFLQNVSRET